MKQNKIVPFEYNNELVRIVLIDEMPWVVAEDVCKILGMSDVYKAVSKLDEDEKMIQKICVSEKERHVIAVNTSGLCKFVLKHNKPGALQFLKWITSDVLPNMQKKYIYEVLKRLEERVDSLEKEVAELKK